MYWIGKLEKDFMLHRNIYVVPFFFFYFLSYIVFFYLCCGLTDWEQSDS